MLATWLVVYLTDSACLLSDGPCERSTREDGLAAHREMRDGGRARAGEGRCRRGFETALACIVEVTCAVTAQGHALAGHRRFEYELVLKSIPFGADRRVDEQRGPAIEAREDHLVRVGRVNEALVEMGRVVGVVIRAWFLGGGLAPVLGSPCGGHGGCGAVHVGVHERDEAERGDSIDGRTGKKVSSGNALML